MNPGIDIEFYVPQRPVEIMQGKLFIDEGGKDYIEYRQTGIGHFSLIPVIFAIAIDSNKKYSLINCYFNKSVGNQTRYLISELYKGAHVSTALEVDCVEVEVQMTGLTNWLNYSRINPEINFSTVEESRIGIKNPLIKVFQISRDVKMELCQYCWLSFDRNETVLQNRSYIKCASTIPISRLELHKNITAFARLLSIFSKYPVELVGEKFLVADGSRIEHLSIRSVEGTDDYENEALLHFNEIEPYLSNVLQIFYCKRDSFKRVIDLFVASVQNSTAEVSFLNITTAFEVFHKCFLESGNEATRVKLLDELRLNGLISVDSKKWDQIIRYWHLFKLTGHIDFFKLHFKNPIETISLLRASRNYYTHYSEPREKIWTPNKLIFVNRALRQLLKATILLQLQLPPELINKLLNSHYSIFYHDYESNEYSLQYVGVNAEY